VDLVSLKERIRNNLLIINDNKDRCFIKVSLDDINKVNELINTDCVDMLEQCSNEMDDIINGIIINIDNELKDLLNKSKENNDLIDKKEIFDKIIFFANSIKYEEENKSYFMGLIKQIYSNIDGDEL